MEKGFKTLELLGDLDDKYIYEASRPWKKQHRFFHIQRSWKTAVAGIILLIMVGCTLRYQEDVKAALQRVTSWIGQALGIKNGDTDSYTNVVGKSISRDGITITLNEIVMDSKNLWIAYSDSEDSDADMKDAVEEDADSIQLWCGDTKTEYPGPSDNGDLSSGSQLPDRDLRTGLGRTEGDPGDKKAF